MLRTLTLAVGLFAAGSAAAQNTVQIPLAYNWNGIAHAGETGQPDAPNGFRSISDRALDFTAGVPSAPVFQRFAMVATAGALDMVLLGNRNTVDGGNWVFDGVPDGDNIGIQPSWLANVNLAGPQATILATPIPIGLQSTASVLFHVSNGGGSCDVTFTYQSGHTSVHTISAPDWFGGSYAGRQDTDRANPGANLNLVEATIGLSADVGESLVRITFGNRSNANADYGIYGVNVEAAPTPSLINHIPLHCNWNGIVHAGEAQQPDAPNGYRSIGTRGLDFTLGVPATTPLPDFQIVAVPGALDMVVLGNRNTTANGAVPFDPAPDGDDLGVQPAWLPNPDLTGPQTTTLAQPILLDGASSARLLFQVTQGGGAFDVTFTLIGGSITVTLAGLDWVGGSFLGTAGTDRALAGVPLRIEDATIDLSAAAGYVLTAITFANRSNLDGAVGILAMNVAGCLACPHAGGPVDLGGGAGPLLTTTSTGHLGLAMTWQLQGATPSTPFGLFAVSIEPPTTLPLALLWPGCASSLHATNALALGAGVDALGAATFTIPAQTNAALCGLPLTAQYVELSAAVCPLLLSNAITITIGN